VHHFRFCNGVPLNESNPDELVNALEYETIARLPGGLSEQIAIKGRSSW